METDETIANKVADKIELLYIKDRCIFRVDLVKAILDGIKEAKGE